MRFTRQQHFLAVAFVLSAMMGCGGSGSPFESVRVSGKVTYEDGSAIPVNGMQLSFISLEPAQNGMHPRPGIVGVGADGTFDRATTYKHDDGLMLGKHKVVVISKDASGLSKKIPRDCAFAKSTPIEVEITHAGQVLEIKVPKP